MSQRDLTAELRTSRISAPNDVRERVRLIAAAATTPPSRFTWRRAFVVAVPIAAAIAAGILLIHPRQDRASTRDQLTLQGTTKEATPTAPNAPATSGAGGAVGSAAALAPAPSRSRAQNYGATLSLRLSTPERVSDGVKRALRIASSLGGYPTSVHATSQKRSASADLTLKVPRAHVQQAIIRLSALGTITSEQVDVQDVQASIDQTATAIDRLQRRLRELRAETQTPAVQRQIAAVTTSIEGLQRSRANALRTTRFATIDLHLATPQQHGVPVKHGHGPLHGLGVAFHWIWIGAVYALALGLPLVVLLSLAWLAVRALRRRREDALLSSP